MQPIPRISSAGTCIRAGPVAVGVCSQRSGNRGVDARFVVKGAARDRRKSEGSVEKTKGDVTKKKVGIP